MQGVSIVPNSCSSQEHLPGESKRAAVNENCLLLGRMVMHHKVLMPLKVGRRQKILSLPADPCHNKSAQQRITKIVVFDYVRVSP